MFKLIIVFNQTETTNALSLFIFDHQIIYYASQNIFTPFYIAPVHTRCL